MFVPSNSKPQISTVQTENAAQISWEMTNAPALSPHQHGILENSIHWRGSPDNQGMYYFILFLFFFAMLPLGDWTLTNGCVARHLTSIRVPRSQPASRVDARDEIKKKKNLKHSCTHINLYCAEAESLLEFYFIFTAFWLNWRNLDMW